MVFKQKKLFCIVTYMRSISSQLDFGLCLNAVSIISKPKSRVVSTRVGFETPKFHTDYKNDTNQFW